MSEIRTSGNLTLKSLDFGRSDFSIPLYSSLRKILSTYLDAACIDAYGAGVDRVVRAMT